MEGVGKPSANTQNEQFLVEIVSLLRSTGPPDTEAS
jgi:hypothetical protein